MPTIPVKKTTKGARPHRQTYHVSVPPEAEPIVTRAPTSKVSSLIPPKKADASSEYDPITGLNAGGWTRDGWHNGRRFDPSGRDRDGYAEFEKQWDDHGFTPAGFTLEDFGRDGNHRDTGTPFGPDGRDRHGFWPDGTTQREGSVAVHQRNTSGFRADATHHITGAQFDEHGFDWDFNHQATGNQFDEHGFGRYGQTRDRTGRDAEGRDYRGFDRTGRDVDGNHHATGTPLDVRGFNVDGVHGETGTTLDAEGWDINKRRANGKVHVKGRDYYGMLVR